jgi:hypothetical protein
MPRLGRIYAGLLMILAGALFSKIFGAYSPLEEFLRPLPLAARTARQLRHAHALPARAVARSPRWST